MDTKRSDIHVVFPRDLRMGRAERVADASVFHRWTAYVNNRGTLCYLTCPKEELHLMFEFAESVKHLDNYQIGEVIQKRINRFIRI